MNYPSSELLSRTATVLEAIICRFLSTGKPVGSRSVVRQFNLNCSPATVRNEMLDLTSMGYIKQTHISSGRIPTDKGIRFYLNFLMREDQLSLGEIERLRPFSSAPGDDFQTTVRNAGRVLADLTRQAGVVLMPGLRHMPLRRIEFLQLTQKRIAAMLISEGGRFFNQVFEWGEALKQQDLAWVSNYLNERFAGKTLSQIRTAIVKEIREEKARYNKMTGKALGLMETVLEQGQLDEEVFIEGRENLVENPEFADSEKILTLFKTFQKKNFIIGLLTKALEESEPVVMLSTETEIEDTPELAIIISRYGTDGPGGGTLGIIGPMRMNYSRVIPMVRYSAKFVSDLLSS